MLSAWRRRMAGILVRHMQTTVGPPELAGGGQRHQWWQAERKDDEREGVYALSPVNVPWVLISDVGQRSNRLRVPGVDGK